MHTNGLPDGPVCGRLARTRHVRLLHVSAPRAVFGRPVKWHQHQADVIRMHALRRWGGVYLDTDALVLQSLDGFRGSGLTVLGVQEDGGICNGAIIAPPSAPFIQRWLAQYASFQDGRMGVHSTYFPMLLAREHTQECILLPPSHMHWPSFSPSGLKAIWLANWSPLTTNVVCVCVCVCV